MNFLWRSQEPEEVLKATESLPKLNVLVIAADKQAADWDQVMRGVSVGGREVAVTQTSWTCIEVSAEPKACYRPSTVMVRVADRVGPSLRPDVVLVRNEVYTPTEDYRNQLYGLMMGGVAGVNSLHSIYCFCEKAVITAELFRLNRHLGDEVFPVIPQSYFSSYRDMMYTNSFPCVVKVGSAHAGMGKMIIRDHHEMEDFRSVLAMTEGKYCTAEPKVEGQYDLRVQKIGSHVRVFKRRSVSGTWKTNTGTSLIEEVPDAEVEPRHKRWAQEAASLFGGLDILSVDAIVDDHTGQEFILEVNGTSSGFAPNCAAEDNEHIRDLLVAELEKVATADEEAAAAAAAAASKKNEGAAANEGPLHLALRLHRSNNTSSQGVAAAKGTEDE